MKTYTLIFATLTFMACQGAKAPPAPDAEAGSPAASATPSASASAAPDAGPMVPDKAKK